MASHGAHAPPGVESAGLLAGARALAGCLVAGLLVGVVVGGLGSRGAMRVTGALDPEVHGVFTDNGNVVGEITLGGTLALVLFVGVFFGIVAGLLVFLVRRWLPASEPWRGLALGVALLALLGRQAVFDPENVDFRILPPVGLSVALFGALFVVAGVVLAPLADRLGPGVPAAFRRPVVTVAGGVLLAGAVAFGLVRLGLALAELLG
jgi:hypothetical protein